MSIKAWIGFLIIQVWFCSILVAQEVYTPVEDRARFPILSPSLSQRQTAKFRLPNGLEVYLIKDPQASQAGAVLTVRAGSWDNPKNYPGLAHFVEHLLFLGTEKYPIETDYDRFIREYNGQSNAYTTYDHTLYLFSISPSAFPEALNRFSFFFKKPLFHPSGVDRELTSVHQEFAKNLNFDNFRENQVMKELANPDHPFHLFDAGNYQTLGSVTPEILKNWYETYYSAHRMRLIVYTPFDLETTKDLVIENFKDVPVNWLPPSTPQIPLLSEKTQGKIVTLPSTQSTQALRLTWEVPQELDWENAVEQEKFIGSILEDEGATSLIAQLKNEGLAQTLTCHFYPLGKETALFSISIYLTPKGFSEIFPVIEQVLQAIQTLRGREIPSFLFDEYKRIHMLNYQYQSRETSYDFLMDLGRQLPKADFASFPEAPLMHQELNSKIIDQFLELLNPQRMHVTLLVPSSEDIVFEQEEKWAQVPYKVEPIPSEKLEEWNHLPPSTLQLPPSNPFIPREVKPLIPANQEHLTDAPLLKPEILVDNEQGRLYFAPDSFFLLPKTFTLFEIRSPAIQWHDPHKNILATLYLQWIDNILGPVTYPAQIANLSHQVFASNHGIALCLEGYSETAGMLFETIVTTLKEIPSPEQFEQIKESLLDSLEKEDIAPLQQGVATYHHLFDKFHIPPEEKSEILEGITYETFLDYLQHLYDQTYVQGIIYGHSTSEQAINQWEFLQHHLSSQPFSQEQQIPERSLVSLEKGGPYMLEIPNSTAAHAIILGIEKADASFKSRAAQQILAQAISGAFYSTLRTKQQTGYLLFSHSKELDQRLFLFFALQSATHDPRDLLARFELFIEDFILGMDQNELTPQRFEAIRHSLLESLERPPQNLDEASFLLRSSIFKHDGDFEWRDKCIQGFKELTYPEFLESTKQFLGKQNRRRLAVLVKGVPSTQEFSYLPLQNVEEIYQSHSDPDPS